MYEEEYRVISLLNAARSAVDLQTLGLTKEQAEVLLTYRAQHGPFTSLKDIDNVPGSQEWLPRLLRAVVRRQERAVSHHKKTSSRAKTTGRPRYSHTGSPTMKKEGSRDNPSALAIILSIIGGTILASGLMFFLVFITYKFICTIGGAGKGAYLTILPVTTTLLVF